MFGNTRVSPKNVDQLPSTDFDLFPFQQPPSIGAFEGSEAVNSTQEEMQNDLIQVFPNPTSNRVKIQGELPKANIKIINHLGQSIKTYSNVSLPLIIDLQGLPKGLYYIAITSFESNEWNLKRVVKK